MLDLVNEVHFWKARFIDMLPLSASTEFHVFSFLLHVSKNSVHRVQSTTRETPAGLETRMLTRRQLAHRGT